MVQPRRMSSSRAIAKTCIEDANTTMRQANGLFAIGAVLALLALPIIRIL